MTAAKPAPTDPYHRRPLSPAEFRLAVERLMELHPGAEITSSWRSESHNRSVGGGDESKHLVFPLTPIAVDIDWPDGDFIGPGSKKALELEHDAKVLGLHGLYHKGHLHVQAAKPGPLPWEYPGRV